MSIAQNIILTGALHSGKSTLLQNVLKHMAPLTCGIFSVPLTDDDQRIGFALRFTDGERLHVFAHKDLNSALRFGRFGITLEPFGAAAAYIRQALELAPPLFVIDEIGVMEAQAAEYWRAIAELAVSPIPTLLVVQQRALPLLQAAVKAEDLKIFELLTDNHRQTTAALLQALAAVGLQNDR